MTNTYLVDVICNNCGWLGDDVEYDVGKAVDSRPCLICGCKQLRKRCFAEARPADTNRKDGTWARGNPKL